MPASDSAWLRAAIGAGDPVQAAPSDAGDRRLVAMLGSGMPKEAYVAPIHSGGRVAALLYADDLPEGRPLGDNGSLAVVLREAGLALDRALQERALAKAPDQGPGTAAKRARARGERRPRRRLCRRRARKPGGSTQLASSKR